MGQRGTPAAYRGYRLQALYTLKRILTPATSQDRVFHLEGLEDLDLWEADGCLEEVIQVKSYENLVLSDLSPSKPNSFFHRAVELLRTPTPPDIKVVNFGSIGPEMRQAWARNEPQRTRVARKLLDDGFEESDIEAIFTHIELVELDEVQEETHIFSFLQDSLTGIDPESAFDLLNFWLYRIAEERGTVTRPDLIDKINSIGRFLAERHTYHSEWFTSIVPIVDQDILNNGQRSWLREEFYAGVATRYEHILAELDFRRENKLAEIAERFKSSRVVIIHGASGQGKTALAYRYLHDAYPEKWRFSIELIEDRQHALKIVRALAGHANALQSPMAIYADVSPRDKEWPEVVKRLARYPYFQILVTIREEDFRRANIPGVEFNYETLELDFNEVEARLIYQRAIASGQGTEFLDFDEAWDKFGGGGPLMEFVYLLTQTTTLRERLQGQVNRIRDEVRSMRAHPDELELLRLVSVISAYEARLHTPSLINELHLPDPDCTLRLFEKEYLIRLSSDRRFVQGLHPIRSRILADLLTSPDISPWPEAATRVLPLMVEEDLESFVLHAFIDRPSERTRLLETVKKLELTTWAGLAGVLRGLLWVGVHDYVESNMPVIEAARKEFGQGWWFAVDLDLVGLTTTELANWWTGLGDLFPPERQARIEEIRARQTPKEEAFELAAHWLAHLKASPVSPASNTDWAGAAEVCFWGAHLGVASHIEQWLSDDDLARATKGLALLRLADLSLALHMGNEKRHTDWMQANLPVLQARLAQEYGVLYLSEQDNALQLHFLPLQFDSDDEGEQKTFTDGQASSDPFHEETMDRIRLVRALFPNRKAYGSQGYGYTIGSLPSPLDSSINKKGVPVSSLPPTWPVRVNSIANGLGRNRFRPNTWLEYVEQVLEMRQLTVICLQQLQQGLIKYLQRRKAVNLLEKYVDMTLWFGGWASISEPPPLPKSAVDPWGLTHEFLSNQPIQSPEQRAYLPKAIALQKYKSYLAVERDYTFPLANFFQQAAHVMLTNSFVGKLAAYSPQRDKLLRILQQQGVKTDLAHLTTYNLATAKSLFPAYQQQFRVLFGHMVGSDEMIVLEEKERDLISRVWQFWYFFANDPEQVWATPLTQIPAKVSLTKRELEERIQRAIEKVAVEGTNITMLHNDKGWDGAPTLWLRLDLENPTELYTKFEELVIALREAIGQVGIQELAHYVIGENWEYIIVVPVIRSRKLDHSAWRLYTFATVLSESEIGEKFWSYVPQPIPSVNWEELELTVWDTPDITLASQFSEAVAELSILAAQLGDLCNIPDLTEPGQLVAQSHIERQAERINQCLQVVFDAITAMVNRFNELPEEEQEERDGLREAIAGLVEMHQLIRPSEEFDGEQAFSIDEVFEYAQRR